MSSPAKSSGGGSVGGSVGKMMRKGSLMVKAKSSRTGGSSVGSRNSRNGGGMQNLTTSMHDATSTTSPAREDDGSLDKTFWMDGSVKLAAANKEQAEKLEEHELTIAVLKDEAKESDAKSTTLLLHVTKLADANKAMEDKLKEFEKFADDKLKDLENTIQLLENEALIEKRTRDEELEELKERLAKALAVKNRALENFAAADETRKRHAAAIDEANKRELKLRTQISQLSIKNKNDDNNNINKKANNGDTSFSIWRITLTLIEIAAVCYAVVVTSASNNTPIITTATISEYTNLAFNAACSPTPPFFARDLTTTIDDDKQSFHAAAPWWAPESAKVAAFEATCAGGDNNNAKDTPGRVRASLRWSSSDGLLTILDADDSSRAPLLKMKAYGVSSIQSGMIHTFDKRGVETSISAPWFN